MAVGLAAALVVVVGDGVVELVLSELEHPARVSEPSSRAAPTVASRRVRVVVISVLSIVRDAQSIDVPGPKDFRQS